MDKTQLENDLGISLDPPGTVPVPVVPQVPAAVGLPERYVVIDAETSGLFRFKDATGAPVPADAPGQPRMAELAMIFTGPGPDFAIEREYQGYVRPEGWVMEEEAARHNGLTTEFLLANGVPVNEVLDTFVAAILEEKRAVIAFNAQFDCKQVRGELRRAGRDDLFELTLNSCAMLGSKDAMQVKKGYKLVDACAFFGVPLIGAHTALGDARATVEIARKLWALGKFQTPAIHYAKNYNPGATP